MKWVDPENIHVTLKFLGTTPVSAVQDIVQRMTKVAAETSCFALNIGAVGCFPNWQRPQVIWVGLEGEIEKLASLQRNLEAAVEDLGFRRENRAFVPHLTLGRVRDGTSFQDKQAFGKWASAAEFKDGGELEVDGLSLMESKLTPLGPIYTRLAFAELA